MSKELVVSSNRHETKLAILEDDRLVEIYVEQRSHHAVAGSIYKGRVSRVLPGMQSAFVKLGIARDAFLYVSDVLDQTAELENVDDTDLGETSNGRSSNRGARSGSERRRNGRSDAPRRGSGRPDGESADEAKGASETEDDAPAAGRSRRRRGRRRNRRDREPLRGAASELPAERTEASASEDRGALPQPEEVDDSGFEVLPGESLSKYDAAAEREGADDPNGEPDVVEEDAVEEDIAEEEIAASDDSSADDAPEDSPKLDDDDIEYDDEVQQETDQPLAAAADDAEQQQSTDDSAEQAEDIEPASAEAVADEQSEPESGAEREEPKMPAEPQPETAEAAFEAEAGVRAPAESAPLQRRGRRRNRRDAEASGQSQQEQDAKDEAESPAVEPAASLSDSDALPNIKNLLKPGQELIVQIAKEPLDKKGARITSHVALPGRFMVYMPTVNHNGVSRRIHSDSERVRLRRIVKAHAEGKPGGFIVRTAGRGASEEELQTDLEFLHKQWQGILEKAENRRAPVLLYHDLDIVERVMRDQLGQGYKTIWVDSEEEYERVLRFVERFQPDLVDRVKFYTRSTPIYDEFNISQELEKALRPKVWLKSGGYLVITQTEALVAIDVNTGKYVGKSDRLEDTVVKTNTEAAEEVVRQMRLRDLGGIVIVDFIDMEDQKNRHSVHQTLEAALRRDRAPAKALPFNDFGLVAITRKRVKQSLERAMCMACPTCSGSGKVKSAPTVIAEILNESRKMAFAAEETKDMVLCVYPEIAKILKARSNSYLQDLEETFKANVLIRGDAGLHPDQFNFH